VATAATTSPSAPPRALGQASAFVVWTLAIGVAGIVGFLWSLSIGPEHIGLGEIVGGIFAPSQSSHELIVHLVRLPRALEAVLVGGSLAVAGAVMQGITLNPLGAPEILGVNAGATLLVTLSVTVATGLSGHSVLALAFIGAAMAAAFVFGFARFGRGGLSPLRLALAGVTVSALLFSLMQSLMILHTETAETLMFWLVGGVNYADWQSIDLVWPWLAGGMILSMLLARPLNVLALGDDMARGLGQNVTRTRFLGAVAVVVLAGASVGIAGPVAFLGLIVPHMVRRLVGTNYLLVIPLSALAGATLFLYADIGSRYVSSLGQTPSGLVTALVGAPIFIYLARREKMAA
jgi:ferric citrate transport system permease protein